MAVVVPLLAISTSTGAEAAHITCRGLEATILGTESDDVLVGTSADDVIVGLDGNDLILGGHGNDVICAGEGNDLVFAGVGNDFVEGGPGADLLFGGANDDRLDGGSGKDGLIGGFGFDTCLNGQALFCESTGGGLPTANAGPDQTVFVTETAVLNGSSSTDPEGDPLTFAWSFVSVPPDSATSLSDPNAVMPSFFVDVPGSYVVQLVVNDGTQDSTADTVTISTTNSPPVANAGSDQSVFVGETVELDGSGSFDVDGDPISHSWSLVSVPSGSDATLSNPAVVMPTFVADRSGTYVAELLVSDAETDGTRDRVEITTENSPPVANAGPDQTAFVGDEVTLDGSASSDVDGDTLTFSWSLSSVPLGSAAAIDDPASVMPKFSVDAPGTYVLQLVVNDGTVVSPPDTATVATLNSAPVAEAGPDQSVFVGDTAVLDGTGSSDVDGDALNFFWSLTTVPAGSTAALSDTSSSVPSFTVDRPGLYVAQLMVNDGVLDSLPDTVNVTTTNSGPLADAGVNQSVLVGEIVTLDGGGSSDPDGDPLTFAWSLTSAPAGSTATLSDPTVVDPTFVADAFGIYVAQLIVNDGTADSPPDTVAITADVAPIVDAGADATIDEGGTFAGAGSFSDPGDDTFTATVDYGDGSGVQALTLNPDNSFALSRSYVDDGVYTVTVTVIDEDGDAGSDSLAISVHNVAPAVYAGADDTIDKGDTFISVGSFIDPGADSFAATVDYGDGSDVQALALNPDRTFALGHTYADDGSFTVTVTVTDDDGGVGIDTASVAVNKSYATAGNTQLTQPWVGGLLDNGGDPLTLVTSGVMVTALGGSVDLASDGSFVYTPPVGIGGAADSFDYDVSDGFETSTRTARIELVGRIWYVDNSAPASGTGQSHSPFATLAEAGDPATSGPGDIIFIFEGTGDSTGMDAGIVLQDNQELIGNGVDLDVDLGGGPVTLVAAANDPEITNTAGVGVALAENNTIAGLIVDEPSDDGISGASVTSLTVDNVTINSNGNAAMDIGNNSPSARVSIGIRNCTIDGTGSSATRQTGIDADFGSSGGDGTVELDITGNTIREVNDGVLLNLEGTTGTGADGANQITISNNAIRDFFGAGLDLRPDGASNNDMVIVDNIIAGDATADSSTQAAIEVLVGHEVDFGVTNLTIEGNDIDDSGSECVLLAGTGSGNVGTLNALLNRNTLTSCVEEGLRVFPDDDATFNVSATDNSITGNGSATTFGFATHFLPVMRVLLFDNEDDQGYVLGCDDTGSLEFAAVNGVGTTMDCDATGEAVFIGHLNDNRNSTGGGEPVGHLTGVGEPILIIDPAAVPRP